MADDNPSATLVDWLPRPCQRVRFKTVGTLLGKRVATKRISKHGHAEPHGFVQKGDLGSSEPIICRRRICLPMNEVAGLVPRILSGLNAIWISSL